MDELANDDHTDLETLAALYGCVRDLIAERDRLRERSISDQETDGAILDLVAPGVPGVNSGDELVDLVREVAAERDRLRTVVERAHDHVALDEQALRALNVDGLIELVSMLRRDHAFAVASTTRADDAADAAAEAMGTIADGLHTVMAERDRLQERIDAYEGDVQAWEEKRNLIKQSSLGTPGAEAVAARTPPGVAKAIVLGGSYLARAEAAEAERERLRAVVDAAREFETANTAWHAKIERGELVQSTDDESRRRAAAISALTDHVRRLDGGEATDG